MFNLQRYDITNIRILLIFKHSLLTASLALSSMMAVAVAAVPGVDELSANSTISSGLLVSNDLQLNHIQDIDSIVNSKCTRINEAGEKHDISLRTDRNSAYTLKIFTYQVELDIVDDLKRSRLLSFVENWNQNSISDTLCIKDNQLVLEQFVAVEMLRTKIELTAAFKAFTKRCQQLWYSFRDLNGC